ncbi:MAG: DUF2254 domain-containing protein [Luteimonas sp.]
MVSTDKWLYLLQRLAKRMWFRASLYCGLGILAALVGVMVQPMELPGELAERFGADSVVHLLTILASSMLVVTTFSVATMVSAYGIASQTATPRAAKLLIEDNGAQDALATFIGAFLFSIVGLIALSTRLYGPSGRLVLFAATILVIVLITVTLLRWIEQLSRFGRVGETINLVETATCRAMQARARAPWLGGVPAVEPPIDAFSVEAAEVGYVEHLDMSRLDEVAQSHGVEIHVVSLPGALAVPGRPLALVSGQLDDHGVDKLRKAFSIGDARTFEHDPRYGLVVLTEIAVRALSPAINDHGTCIDIIGTVVRLLDNWSEARIKHAGHAEIDYPRVFVPGLSEADMFDDIFPLIAREGAHMREIGIRLQKAFAALSTSRHALCAEAARQHARQAFARAMEAITFEADRQALRDVALADAYHSHEIEGERAAEHE